MTKKTEGRFRDAFAAGEFRVLLAALAVQTTGAVFAALALTVLVYQDTGSPLLAALTFTMPFLPYVISGGLLAGLADRVPPRRLLMTCDSASACLAAGLAIPGMPIPGLFALLVCIGLIGPLSAGTRSALLPEIMPASAVVPARSLIRMSSLLAQTGGFALGGLLLTALTPRQILVVDALALATSALVVRVFLHPHPARRAATGSVVRDSTQGARRVLATPSIRRVLLLSWYVPFLTVMPEGLAAPAAHRRHLGPDGRARAGRHPGRSAGRADAAPPGHRGRRALRARRARSSQGEVRVDSYPRPMTVPRRMRSFAVWAVLC